MNTTHCECCGNALKNSLDNWGDYYYPICLECHLKMWDQESQPFYGGAMNLPAEPASVGTGVDGPIKDYDLGWAIFRADPECEGFGVYYPK